MPEIENCSGCGPTSHQTGPDSRYRSTHRRQNGTIILLALAGLHLYLHVKAAAQETA
jgi:hypothetical protein